MKKEPIAQLIDSMKGTLLSTGHCEDCNKEVREQDLYGIEGDAVCQDCFGKGLDVFDEILGMTYCDGCNALVKNSGLYVAEAQGGAVLSKMCQHCYQVLKDTIDARDDISWFEYSTEWSEEDFVDFNEASLHDLNKHLEEEEHMVAVHGQDVWNALNEKLSKPRMDLLPGGALMSVAKVLTMGAAKHGERSWMNYPEHSYIAAIGRHYASVLDGEMIDKESGETHFAHIAASCLFLDTMIKGK